MAQPRSENGPRPIRVWGKEGITWPCMAAGGRYGTEVSVALATDFSGRPFTTLMPMVGACGLRLERGALGANSEATGAGVSNASTGRMKVGGITVSWSG